MYYLINSYGVADKRWRDKSTTTQHPTKKKKGFYFLLDFLDWSQFQILEKKNIYTTRIHFPYFLFTFLLFKKIVKELKRIEETNRKMGKDVKPDGMVFIVVFVCRPTELGVNNNGPPNHSAFVDLSHRTSMQSDDPFFCVCVCVISLVPRLNLFSLFVPTLWLLDWILWWQSVDICLLHNRFYLKTIIRFLRLLSKSPPIRIIIKPARYSRIDNGAGPRRFSGLDVWEIPTWLSFQKPTSHQDLYGSLSALFFLTRWEKRL